MDMVVGMRWDGNGGAQGRAGVFWRMSSQVGQSLKLGSAALQGFPRGAAAADDDGCRLCGVRTKPACQCGGGGWSSPPNLDHRNNLQQSHVQDLDSIKFSVHDTEVQQHRHHQAGIDVGRVTSASSTSVSLQHTEHVENTNTVTSATASHRHRTRNRPSHFTPVSAGCAVLPRYSEQRRPGRPIMWAACLLPGTQPLHSTAQRSPDARSPGLPSALSSLGAGHYLFPLLGSPFSVEAATTRLAPRARQLPFRTWPVQPYRGNAPYQQPPQPPSRFQLQHQSITTTRPPPFFDCDHTKSASEKTRAISRYPEEPIELDCLGALQPTIHPIQVETESRRKRPPIITTDRQTDHQ